MHFSKNIWNISLNLSNGSDQIFFVNVFTFARSRERFTNDDHVNINACKSLFDPNTMINTQVIG